MPASFRSRRRLRWGRRARFDFCSSGGRSYSAPRGEHFDAPGVSGLWQDLQKNRIHLKVEGIIYQLSGGAGENVGFKVGNHLPHGLRSLCANVGRGGIMTAAL